MGLQDMAAIATILALLVSLVSIAFSARRYLDIRERDQEKERFERYHNILKTISKGSDAEGSLKLISQIAFIAELVRFPEYSASSQQALRLLRDEWSRKEPEIVKKPLISTIDETLSELETLK